MSMKIKRPDYAAQYGPTTGDKVYLADTGLVAEIEHPFAQLAHRVVRLAHGRNKRADLAVEPTDFVRRRA